MEAHLGGDRSLLLGPMDHNGIALWGALDVDEYKGLDFMELARKLDEHSIPAIVCRSKSGGAHIYMFTTGVPALTLVSHLQHVARLLGLPAKTEIFPKQTSLAPEQVGSLINVPYFASDTTNRYAFGANDSALMLAEFLDRAESSRVGEEFFARPLPTRTVEQGTRDTTVFKLIHAWHDDGLAEEELLAKALHWNQTRSTAPLEEKVIREKVKRIYRKPRTTQEQKKAFSELKPHAKHLLREGASYNDTLTSLGNKNHDASITLSDDTVVKALSKAQKELTQEPEWYSLLLKTSTGKIKPLLANAEAALAHHPDWGGALRFDRFRQCVITARPTPASDAPIVAWNDEHTRRAILWLQRNGVEIGKDITHDAVLAVAEANSFDSLIDFLESLQWDGVPRLDKCLNVYLGAEDTPFNSAIGPKFFISGAARGLKPGCKVDTILVLEGDQGLLKSTALESLVPRREWFVDHLPDLRTKDAYIRIDGKWIVEDAEYDSMGKSEAGRMKAFASENQVHIDRRGTKSQKTIPAVAS
jgi:hypothetical protein